MNISDFTTWFFENGDITNKGSFILGIFISFIISVLLGYLTNPSLEISLIDDKGDKVKYLHVRVKNKGRFLFINRETAYETTGEITFKDTSGNLLAETFFPKWASKPNPIIPVVFHTNVSLNARPVSRSGFQFDETKIADSKIEDIYSGSSKLLDVAVKFLDDSEFYAMTPENFADPSFKPSDRKFIGTEYLVNINIQSENGAHCQKEFRLVNRDTTLEGFFLAQLKR